MLRAVFSGRGCAVIEPEPTLCADEAKPDVKGNGNEQAINEALAEIVAKHPKRFGPIATLPGKTIDGPLSEMGIRAGYAQIGWPQRARIADE